LGGVRLVEDNSGLYIHNRGQDLTVWHLSIYRQPADGAKQQVDPSKPRVHMIEGQVIYGRLFVEEGNAYVLNEDQTRHDIDLEQVDRIVRPDIKLATTTDIAEIFYADGGVVRGQVQQLNSDRVILQTAFAEEPVACALTGASMLRLGPLDFKEKGNTQSRNDDQLFCASGLLNGRLSFNASSPPLRWKFEGATEPVRLAEVAEARVERSKAILTESTFDIKAFPELLHLKNGEVLPCQVESYDKNTLVFQSPFIVVGKVDSAHVKGIEFANGTFGAKDEESVTINDVKLERALTVPRFNRDNPPSHVLVAKTGDLMRGSLLGISRQIVQFESKLRTLVIPINRLIRVVDVSKPEEDTEELAAIAASPKGTVRANLSDGSILVFEALKSMAGKLLGHSPIYGEMAIPIGSIQHLTFGEFEKEGFDPLFEEWVVQPSKEPEFGKQSLP